MLGSPIVSLIARAGAVAVAANAGHSGPRVRMVALPLRVAGPPDAGSRFDYALKKPFPSALLVICPKIDSAGGWVIELETSTTERVMSWIEVG
jgi:hypothetical protein